MENKDHQPRWKYDCTRCKFDWNCGPLCACILSEHVDPPDNRKLEVDSLLLKAGLTTTYLTALTREEL